MVQSAKFKRKMSAMKTLVNEKLTEAVERQAEAVVKEMRLMLAIQEPGVAAKTEIGWTWGDDTPRGSVTVGKTSFGGEAMAVTIYATAQQGSGFSAGWFEFGTKPLYRSPALSVHRVGPELHRDAVQFFKSMGEQEQLAGRVDPAPLHPLAIPGGADLHPLGRGVDVHKGGHPNRLAAPRLDHRKGFSKGTGAEVAIDAVLEKTSAWVLE